MAGKQRYTVGQVAEALDACKGLIYLAARRLGCTSATVINYTNRYPSLRAIVAEFRGRRVDAAEAALDKAVLAGEPWAVLFLLRTQGKDRGYTEKAGPDVAERVRQRVVEEVVDADAAPIVVRTRGEASAILPLLECPGGIPEVTGRPGAGVTRRGWCDARPGAVTPAEES